MEKREYNTNLPRQQAKEVASGKGLMKQNPLFSSQYTGNLQLLEKTFASLREAVFIIDAESTRILNCNPAASQIFGYKKEEMLGQTTTFLHVCEEKLKEFRESLFSAIEEKGSLDLSEFQMKRKNGEVFFTEHSVMPLEDDQGERIGWVSVVRDITKRKQAEAALQRYQLLAYQSRDIILFVRRNDGHILEANTAALKAYGYTREELLNLAIHDLRSPETARLTADQLAEANVRGLLFETMHRHKNGYTFPVEVSTLGATIGGTRILISIIRDITKRKQIEEELQRYRDELEKRVQERTEALAKSQQRFQVLSSQLLLAQEKERRRVAVELHDGLLSELAATKYLLEGKIMLMQKGNLSDPSELRKVVDILATTMQEARRIMNNLHPSVLDELGLIAALHWSFGEYQKAYPHIRVETKIEVSEQDISESIRVVIFRVLQEALNNFARHGKGDRVELSLSKTQRTFALMIRDNGKGFDVKRAARGLGLESMRERVELSGGAFQIESVIGQGTTIRATWISS
jgi:PAS domain S-box-containing protein